MVFKIVLTGGPCAGKTTLLNKLSDYLKTLDYKYLPIGEAATDLMEKGIKYEVIGDTYNFQTLLFEHQLFNENLRNNAMNVSYLDKFIVLCDRGTLDNKAYCDSSKMFDRIVKEHGISEIDLIDSYDLVIDLITLADCAPEKYNITSNLCRRENREEAIVSDRKTSNAYAGSRNMKIINTSISVDEVFEIIKKEIDDLLNNRYTKEIHKYYIDNKIEDFSEYNDETSRLINIEEVLLRQDGFNNKIQTKIYKRTYKGSSSYILNVIKEENNKIITCIDEKITFNKYIELMNLYGIQNSKKYDKLSFIKDRQAYDIKFCDDCTILEYEENKLNEKLELPEYIKIIDTVDEIDNKRAVEKIKKMC